MIAAVTPERTVTAESIFMRVIAGVDGSEPGFEAVAQAARLVAPIGSLELLCARRRRSPGRGRSPGS
jgi:hypothetical protein